LAVLQNWQTLQMLLDLHLQLVAEHFVVHFLERALSYISIGLNQLVIAVEEISTAEELFWGVAV